jgi:hypothetical protein
MSLYDFKKFKRIMIKRNKKLESEAIALLEFDKKSNTTANEILSEQFADENLTEMEQQELLQALKLSREISESANEDIYDYEKELEEAIKLSLEENQEVNLKENEDDLRINDEKTNEKQISDIQTSPIKKEEIIPEQKFSTLKNYSVLPGLSVKKESKIDDIENVEERSIRLKEQRDRLLSIKNKTGEKVLNK